MRKLFFGADYNPEQWPDATLADDIRMMRAAGVSMVSVGIFSWALLEPEEGHYSFEWLDRVIDALHDGGIAVDLATGTASPPAWLAAAYPQTLPVTADGVRLGTGSRQQFCPSSSRFREAASSLAGALARRYGEHPAVQLWHVSNEYGCHVAQCYCEASVHAFRAWLRAKYETIDALNDAWGTAFWSQRYATFDHVAAPAAMPTFPNPGQVADFAEFSSDELLARYLAERDAIRAHAAQPITTNFMGLFAPVDYRKWAPHVDVVSDDSYPDPALPGAARETALVSDLMRSLKDGAPFYLLEQTTAAVQWRERNSRKRPGVFQLQSLQRVARGADAIMQFQWRQSVRGAEAFHSAMVPHAGTDSRTWGEVCGLGEVLGRLSDVVGGRVETPIALFVDWPALWQRAAAVGPGPDRTEEAIRAWHATAFERGHAVDFVFADSDLSGYRVIIVPEPFAMSERVAQELTKAARAGAQVVVTAPAAVTDRTGRAYEGGYGRVLGDLLGVRVIDHDLPSGPAPAAAHPAIDPRVDRISTEIAVPATAGSVSLDVALRSALFRVLDAMGRPRPAICGEYWAEEVWADDDVEVLAEFDGPDLAGMPAITHRPMPGGGGGTYVATDLDPAGRSAVFRLAEARARVVREGADVPAGVEVVRRAAVTFYLNHGERAAQIAGVSGWDIVSDQAVGGHLVLPPRSAAAVR